MPLRSELAAGREDASDTADDETPPSDAEGEPTATVSAPAPRRWWSLFGRRAKEVEPESVSAVQEDEQPEEAAKAASRVPVGKASRTARTAEPESPSDEQAVADDVAADGEGSGEAHAEQADETSEAGDVPPEDQILVPHRPAGKRLTIAAAAAAAVFVGAAAFGGAMLQPYLADRALVHTKLDIARTAASAITTLWTYTPENMDKLPDRAAGFLGGDFANEYRKYIDAIVAPNKQAQVTNTTQVMGTAVESVSPTEATALVYTNSVATSPGSKNIPSLRYLSYRLTMQRHAAKWLITRMSTVTSFDLTPQL
jgi:Mce-associated membrane protein